jgi:hypothetical protein
MALEGFKPVKLKERRAIEPSIAPCANCGSTKYIKSYMNYTKVCGEKILFFELYCDECGYCIRKEGFDCRRNAIMEWNRRYKNGRE